MVLSAPSIMPPRVRLPSTPSMLLSFKVKFVLVLWKRTKINQKEAGFGPFFKKRREKKVHHPSRTKWLTWSPCLLQYVVFLYKSNLCVDLLKRKWLSDHANVVLCKVIYVSMLNGQIQKEKRRWNEPNEKVQCHGESKLLTPWKR